MAALIPLALTLAPELARWLFGSTGDKTVRAVTAVVQAATGSTDLDAVRAVLAKDPTAIDTLRVELAKVAAEAEQNARASEVEVIRLKLADIADARHQTQSLASIGSTTVWGAPAISLVVLVTFGVVMWAAMTHTLPPTSETVVNILLGALSAMATSVVGYWVGSSAGSDTKTGLLYRSQPAKSLD